MTLCSSTFDRDTGRFRCATHGDEHRMLPGSHERMYGPECFCGSGWDAQNDACLSQSEVSA